MLNNEQKCCGIIKVSVFKYIDLKSYSFSIEADSDDILSVSYIIEDTLKLY